MFTIKKRTVTDATMSFPGFTSFDEDPFFERHSDRLKEFDKTFVKEFSLLRPEAGPRPAIEASADTHGNANDAPMKVATDHQDVFGFGDMFSRIHRRMNHMIRNMMSSPDDLMRHFAAAADDRHTYMQSSMYSYNNTGEAQPTVYEAHKSRRTAPGGIAEEKKVVKDSKSNLEKIRVSRKLNDREHVVEKTRHADTDEIQQHQDLVGMEKSEVDKFNREWQEATTGLDGWMNVGPFRQIEQGDADKAKPVKSKY